VPGVTISVIESFPAAQGITMGNSWDATHDSSLPVPAGQTGRNGQRQGSCNSNCFAVTVVQGCPEVILQS